MAYNLSSRKLTLTLFMGSVLHIFLMWPSHNQKFYYFFNTPKRKTVLLEVIKNTDVSLNAGFLKRLCATRYIVKYDAVHGFIKLLEYTLESLEEIYTRNDKSTDAKILIYVKDFECFVSLFVINALFGYGLLQCKQFQEESLDLKAAVTVAEGAVIELKKIRGHSEKEF
ncbi:hypothetical protein PR048_018118 [Dryococelus australis]|uniref:Uncharacterized protein n=1 Tax=Dryococelus australis TaxID=614101 RepID=A0ABQ9HBH5_9NEOP|nr:hypothetical protein PR048_018118 [Dryococelus australis]